MAAFSKVPKFTLQELLARVVLDVQDKTKEAPVRSVDEVIKSSTYQFSCLQESIPNYYDFIGEARKELLCIYGRYETGSGRTEKVLKLSTPVWPMICSEVIIWLKGIQRRMLVNQRAHNPWSIEIKRDLPEQVFQVFQHMRDAIKGSSTAFGVSIQTHELKFINRNRLLRDFSILCSMPSSKISAKLQKSFGGK